VVACNTKTNGDASHLLPLNDALHQPTRIKALFLQSTHYHKPNSIDTSQNLTPLRSVVGIFK